jgi:peptidoglycan/xylan/chitin deacetylase (PgdA/CDA1 family)
MVSYLKNYSDIPVTFSLEMRNIFRSSLIKTFSFFQSSNEHKNGIQFLYFHHIFNDEIILFEECIIELMKTYKFISYSVAIEMIQTNSIDDLYVCISSDDGFKNNLNSLIVLEKFDISACFFVNPLFIGETSIEKLITITNTVFNLGSKPIEFLNWNELELLIKNKHEIGSHTLSHKRLSKISFEEQEVEIIESKRILEANIGKINHFAFPYGTMNDINSTSLEIIKNAGYKSCASAIRGFHNDILNNQMPIVKRDPIVFKNYQQQLNYFNKNNIRNSIC